jgi:glutaminyl-peptide cyclotransferase
MPIVRLATTLALALLAACGGDDTTAEGTVVLPPNPFGQQPEPAPGPPPAVPFSPQTPVYAAREVRSWPHDRQAFTQGLLVHDGTLYESTGLEGKSSVRQVRLETGEVLRRTDTPARYFGEGIAAVGDRLYQLTWKDGKGFVYDARTLAVADSFTYRGEGWSLTTHDSLLYMSDGSSRIRVVDPDGFRELRTIAVTEAGRPVFYLNELEWVDGELWANVWMTHWIARIDPATGNVVGWIDLRGLLTQEEAAGVDVTNGIAWDAANDRVLVTGKYWPKLVEIGLTRR